MKSVFGCNCYNYWVRIYRIIIASSYSEKVHLGKKLGEIRFCVVVVLSKP